MSAFFRGTSSEQDPRFSDKERLLRSRIRLPPAELQTLDLASCDLSAVSALLSRELRRLLGDEDEVLQALCMALLTAQPPDPQALLIQLTAFIGLEEADRLLHSIAHTVSLSNRKTATASVSTVSASAPTAGQPAASGSSAVAGKRRRSRWDVKKEDVERKQQPDRREKEDGSALADSRPSSRRKTAEAQPAGSAAAPVR
jgi:hypothetical protein